MALCLENHLVRCSALDGAPVLHINAAMSTVALPVRQTMLKSLWEHFKVLYQDISPKYPTLAAEHALTQEEETYSKSTKLTYRHAVISTIASIKRRPSPDNINHPSVGTEGQIAKREEDRKKLQALKITVEQLEPYALTQDEMKQWGYIVDIPAGPGGDRPSEEGSIMKCERCNQQFKVKRREEADETTDEEPCTRGHHVFYESNPEDLHKRHAFSHTRPPTSEADDTALDIIALDCEMIYSTGGMRVARVSVVDSMGKEIFDEIIRMDDGVEVIDFNTRFSGITEENYSQAVLQLAAIRKSLDAYINSNTLIIGHALDNDLKTLRMIHHRCVDTAIIFPHRAGAPYRRALRDLAVIEFQRRVKEHLGKVIQTGGGTVGHSSVEDSVATLDLVRWRILNGPKPRPKPAPIPEDDILSI
ncbi:hypothetical protein PHLGIDRAFT_11157 [Phlebiopsis gigantea 11061_1 CR5-6]|uniref:Exonuclease domain-containing protein n=1 Tax=Phlebiopsis gigantea (strain 11061_1 CR5-6) TaxID=745531 RepID=A0A0C3NZ33_PHLG1|nr:hypothetical protein PHLGIDRAFT_11157 [Phlebiopsis gigantea 11061_1 CR5-6]